MARAPVFNLRQEDIPQVEGMDKLLRALGGFAGQVQSALSNSLSFKENLNSEIVELDISTVSDIIALTLIPPWTTLQIAGAAGYHTPPVIRKSSEGFVITHGVIAGGNAGTIAAQIPLSFAPARRVIGLSHGKFFDNEAPYRWEVFPTGEIRLGGGVKNSLSCSFFNLHASWLANDISPITNPVFPIRARLNLRENVSPIGALVIKAVEFVSQKEQRIVKKALSVDWEVQSGYLVVNDIPGLVPGKRYKVSVLVIGD